MIKFNDTFIIGIDHGYGNLKTANTVTPPGVKIHESEPPFKKNVLEYDGKISSTFIREELKRGNME